MTHLDADELEEAVSALMPLLKEYGTDGIDEAVAELNRRIITGEID